MFIFNGKMPTYLKPADFDVWHTKISEALKKIGLPATVSNDLTVAFSDEEETRTYGALDMEEIKRRIKKRRKTDERVDELLEEIHTPADYRNAQAGRSLAEVICSLNPAEDYEQVLTELNTLFHNLAFQEAILGKYIHPQKIILYTKAIQRSADPDAGGKTQLQAFESTFAHEMFHAYHYQSNADELTCRRDYTSKVVKESLASAFEWYYCQENGIPGAGALMRSWKNPVFSYPYSGAQRLVCLDARKGPLSLDKPLFCDVFGTSLKDMDAALRLLLYLNDFYAIKNAVQISERIIREKVSTGTSATPLTYAEYGAIQFARKVAEMAKAEIPDIVKANPALVNDLLDKDYCKKTFGFHSYSVLSPVVITSGKSSRYYRDLPIVVHGTTYYLCNNWLEKHRIPLFHWIWENRVEKTYSVPEN